MRPSKRRAGFLKQFTPADDLTTKIEKVGSSRQFIIMTWVFGAALLVMGISFVTLHAVNLTYVNEISDLQAQIDEVDEEHRQLSIEASRLASLDQIVYSETDEGLVDRGLVGIMNDRAVEYVDVGLNEVAVMK